MLFMKKRMKSLSRTISVAERVDDLFDKLQGALMFSRNKSSIQISPTSHKKGGHSENHLKERYGHCEFLVMLFDSEHACGLHGLDKSVCSDCF